MKRIKLNLREISQTLNQKNCWKISCKYFCIPWIIYHLLYLHSLSMLINTRLFLCTVMVLRAVLLMLHLLFLSSCHLWIFTLMTHDESDQSSSMKNTTEEVKYWCLQPPQHKPQKIKTEGFSASPRSFFSFLRNRKNYFKCKFNQKILLRTNVCTGVVYFNIEIQLPLIIYKNNLFNGIFNGKISIFSGVGCVSTWLLADLRHGCLWALSLCRRCTNTAVPFSKSNCNHAQKANIRSMKEAAVTSRAR